MAGIGSLTLDQIEQWDTHHLADAARHWRETAERWQSAFDASARAMWDPGGTPWTGPAAATAQNRSQADASQVRGQAGLLREAASIASAGQTAIYAAKQDTLSAIEDARGAGFVVDSDLSVRPPRPVPLEQMAATYGRAQEFATQIQTAAARLLAEEVEVADNLGAISAQLAGVQFPADHAAAEPAVQAVDYRFKQDPPPTDPTVDRHPDYPGRRTDGKFAPGNSGADGDTAAQQYFDKREKRTGLPIERQEVAVRVTDPDTGQVYTRYYDGLEPVPGQPGKYVGLEHKYGTGRLTPQQAKVDALVNKGAAAKGNLNGKPIEVVKALEFNTPALPPPPAEPATPADAPKAPVAEPGSTVPARAPPIFEPRGLGGPGTPPGPTPVPPPHSIDHLPVMGRDDPNAPWEYEE